MRDVAGSTEAAIQSALGAPPPEHRFIATALVLDGSTLEVTELLSVPSGWETVQPGFHVEGRHQPFDLELAHDVYQFDCSDHDPDPFYRPGDTVLVTFEAPAPSEGSCDDCAGGCRAACPSASFRVQGFMLPVQSAYDFNGTELTLEELPPLTQDGACRMLFPHPPETDCDDVASSEPGGCGK